MLEGGPSAVTYSALAERSGVGRATLYRHWPDLDQLWRELMATRAAKFEFDLVGDLSTDLRSALEVSYENLQDPSQFAMMVTTLERSLWDDLSRNIVTTLEKMTPVRKALELAVANRQLPADTDVSVAASLVMGPFLHRMLMAHQPVDDEFIDRVVDAFVRGPLRQSRRGSS